MKILKWIRKNISKILGLIWGTWLVLLIYTVATDDFELDPFVRTLFSAKNFWYDWYGVKVKTYILNSEQVSQLLKDPSINLKSWDHYEGNKNEQFYYVIGIKTGSSILGELLCKFPTGEKAHYVIGIDPYSTPPIKHIVIPCPPKIYNLLKKSNPRWQFYKKPLEISSRWETLIFCK